MKLIFIQYWFRIGCHLLKYICTDSWIAHTIGHKSTLEEKYKTLWRKHKGFLQCDTSGALLHCLAVALTQVRHFVVIVLLKLYSQCHKFKQSVPDWNDWQDQMCIVHFWTNRSNEWRIFFKLVTNSVGGINRLSGTTHFQLLDIYRATISIVNMKLHLLQSILPFIPVLNCLSISSSWGCLSLLKHPSEWKVWYIHLILKYRQ